MVHLVIGICTRGRLAALGRCLRALEGLRLPSGMRRSLVVVDNHTSPHSQVRALCEQHAPHLHYKHCDKTRNQARNKVLETALHLRADYVALCDDDSRVPADWIISLYTALKVHDADVVTAPLVLRSPKTIPLPLQRRYAEWLSLAPVRKAQHVRMARASNVLFKAELIAHNAKLRFDEGFQSYGEDTHFFMRAWLSGARMVEIPEAAIEEHWTKERLRFGYFLKRHYAIGRDTTRLECQLRGLTGIKATQTQALWKGFKGLVWASAGWILAKDHAGCALKGLLLIGRACGLVSGLWTAKRKP